MDTKNRLRSVLICLYFDDIVMYCVLVTTLSSSSLYKHDYYLAFKTNQCTKLEITSKNADMSSNIVKHLIDLQLLNSDSLYCSTS